MLELDAPIIARHRPAPGLHQLVLGAPALAAAAQPGQFALIGAADSGSYDPLTPAALAFAGLDRAAGTVTLLAGDAPWAQRAFGERLRVRGPLGQGWAVAPAARHLLLIGTADGAASLLALVALAVGRQLATTLVIGAPIGPGIPASLVPPAVEYHLARGRDPSAAALELVDDAMLRWADAIYTTLPPPAWAALGQRIERTRLRWDRGLAWAAHLPSLPCGVGVCGACAIEVGRRRRLACTDGPVFDLRDSWRL